LAERGLSVDHVTVWRWVQRYAPELERRLRRHLKPTNDSWRVDETYVRVKGKWVYLYRAVDSSGATIDFLLSAKRDAATAQRFLAKAFHLRIPEHFAIARKFVPAPFASFFCPQKIRKTLQSNSDRKAAGFGSPPPCAVLTAARHPLRRELRLMMRREGHKMRREGHKVDGLRHGRVAGMVGMEIIPRQLGERAVG
jgi:hypothetical protein